MKKIAFYTYLGTNGIITSRVHLEDIYYTKRYQLIADPNHKLTKDNENFVENIVVPEEELSLWKEVEQ